MKFLFFSIALFLSLTACDSKKKAANALPDDPCLRIDQTLIGTFRNPIMEGSMTFTGGLKGSVDISGNDYNDITCTYTIDDCAGKNMNMLCDGSAYTAEFEIFNRDSIRVDAMHYGRLR